MTVIAPAAGTFEALVVGDQPLAWWRLNEPAGAVTAVDGMGRHDGVVNGAIAYGVPGALTTSPENTAASFDGDSYIRVPYASALNSVLYSIECWAKVPDLENYCVVSSISVASSTSPYKGKGYMVTSDGGSWRACSGRDDQYAYYYSALGSVVPGTWAHAVMTYDGTSGQVYYLNGIRVPETGGFSDFVRNVTADLLIGAAGPGIGALSVPFKGEIDEVAFYNTTLSLAQVQAHYAAALYGTNVAPIFKTQPIPTTVKLHSSITLRVVAEGSVQISYQWLKDGAPLVGKTNASLALNNLAYTDGGDYSALAMNPVGTNTSATAKVVVLTDTPQSINATNDLVLHLKFEDDYADASGRGHNGTDVGGTLFVPGKVGKALSYSTTVDGGSVASAGYVTMNPSPDFAFPSNQSFSISMWVQMPSNSIPGDLPFFGNATGSANSPGFVFAPSYKLGGWQWTLNDGTVNLGVTGGDDSINDGEWHHLFFAFDRTTGYARSYLNGIAVDETALGGLGTIERPDPVAIGQDPTGTYAEAGSASIDDIGVWRRALSSYEAYAIYYVGATLGKSFDTPAAPEVRIEIQPISGGIELRWSSGTLESSDRADGGYTTVPGASSPHPVTPATGNKFYRIRVQ